MRGGKLEVVRGSGNVFRDLARRTVDAEQHEAILATEIIGAIDQEGSGERAAQAPTGIAAADFSRIRNSNLERFTIERLMLIINRLGARVELKVRLRRTEDAEIVSG